MSDTPSFSVLTQPVASLPKQLAKRVLKVVGLRKSSPKYGGHPAVTRSLVEGLATLGATFNYNPAKLDELHDIVVVLSSIGALRQAIRLKKQGRIRRLLAGPNLVVLPTDFDGIATSPEIDTYILNSPWTQNMYELVAPTLKGRVRLFPSGVDAKWWWDGPRAHRADHMLFYEKRPPRRLYDACTAVARAAGFNVDVVQYGSYTVEDFRARLHNSGVLVHWAEQESQGISNLEAWSANVPTLIWDPGSFLWQGANYDSCSCPYLSRATGRSFRDVSEFESLLREGGADRSRYTPRQWVLDNLTDARSAQLMLEIVAGRPSKLPLESTAVPWEK